MMKLLRMQRRVRVEYAFRKRDGVNAVIHTRGRVDSGIVRGDKLSGLTFRTTRDKLMWSVCQHLSLIGQFRYILDRCR